MFIQRYGNGLRAFLALHGWSGDHRTFEPLLRYLPTDASFYSVDLPGYGQSPRLGTWERDVCSSAFRRRTAAQPLPPLEGGTTNAPLALTVKSDLVLFAAAIGEVIDQLDAERFTLVGNCSGALLGLLAVPSRLARVERLVLLDPFAFVPWYFRLFIAKPFGKYAYYSTFANPLGRWLTNLSLAKHRTDATDLTGSFSKVDHTVSFRYLELLASLGSIERFRDVHAPTDIVYGARSFQAVKASVAMWQALWPHAQAWELAGAGHLPILEATEALSRIVFASPESWQR